MRQKYFSVHGNTLKHLNVFGENAKYVDFAVYE
jgi:hypothetical protein